MELCHIGNEQLILRLRNSSDDLESVDAASGVCRLQQYEIYGMPLSCLLLACPQNSKVCYLLYLLWVFVNLMWRSCCYILAWQLSLYFTGARTVLELVDGAVVNGLLQQIASLFHLDHIISYGEYTVSIDQWTACTWMYLQKIAEFNSVIPQKSTLCKNQVCAIICGK